MELLHFGEVENYFFDFAGNISTLLNITHNAFYALNLTHNALRLSWVEIGDNGIGGLKS